MVKNYQNVGVKKELIERIKWVIAKNIGYRSISEFVNEAVRYHLMRIEGLIKAKKGELIYG